VRSAKAVQDDIVRSKTWAAEIARQAEAPAASGRDIAAAEERIAFIAREAQYADQLCWVLEGLRDVDALLAAVEQAAAVQGHALEALRLLERAWAAMDRVPVAKSCRVMRLLSLRSFELKSALHEVFDRAWKALVAVDVEEGAGGRVVIRGESAGPDMLSLEDVVVGLRAYKEVDERMEQLWHNLDAAVVGPRMRRGEGVLPRVRVDGGVVELHGAEPPSIDALLDDVRVLLEFLSARLPADLVPALAATMMADLVPRLVHVWLDAEVPSSLHEMDRFQRVIASAGEFARALDERVPAAAAHAGPLREWVDNAPAIWLAKCRETALESIREQLTAGIVGSREVERVERRVVEEGEGGEEEEGGGDGDDWDAKWDDDDDDGQVNDDAPSKTDSAKGMGSGDDDDDNKAEDDWGWGDEGGGGKGGDGWDDWGDDGEEKKPAGQQTQTPRQEKQKQTKQTHSKQQPQQQSRPDHKQRQQQKQTAAAAAAAKTTTTSTREVVVRETYHISSMPDPMLELVFAILEDGAALTQTECVFFLFFHF
jgi:centromere/kinetochore protein ZW10